MFFHKKKNQKFALAIGGIFLVVLGIIFWQSARKANSISVAENENIFRSVLFDPIPEGVKNIERLTLRGGGTDTYLKFRATEGVLYQLLALHPYKKVDCSDKSILQPLFSPEESSEIFVSTKRWDVLKLKNPECYTTLIFNETGIEGKLYSNKFRQNAQSEFIFDRERNIIYFHERGT